VDHVLLHELAHTRYLDHGADFRRLLRTLDPEHDRHRRALADAWQGLPAWWWEGGCLPAA
jgi:predicted metal-dependent hydrolase